MSPIYAILAAPVVRPLGIDLLLWFTHWRNSLLLRAAEQACTVVLTVTPDSFPLRSRKVRPIGHGVDVAEFACVDRSAHPAPLRVLALGRTSPAKGLPVVIRAAALANARGVGVELELRGPSLTPDELRHRDELRVVQEPVPRTDVPALLARADVLVNNMRAGAPDKVVFEACATCLPVLASNPSFAALLDDELRFDRDSPEELADRLGWLASLGPDERAAVGRRLRERVEAGHSVEHWADQVLLSVRRP
jgi:glycosyltransferase involved in cell wall biosynthesis